MKNCQHTPETSSSSPGCYPASHPCQSYTFNSHWDSLRLNLLKTKKWTRSPFCPGATLYSSTMTNAVHSFYHNGVHLCWCNAYTVFSSSFRHECVCGPPLRLFLKQGLHPLLLLYSRSFFSGLLRTVLGTKKEEVEQSAGRALASSPNTWVLVWGDPLKQVLPFPQAPFLNDSPPLLKAAFLDTCGFYSGSGSRLGFLTEWGENAGKLISPGNSP